MASNKPAITAFHGIFEQKLAAYIKKIRKLRKNPEKKTQVKQLLHEARQLKKLIKKERKSSIQHSMEVPISIVDGEIVLEQTSSKYPIQILDTRLVGGLLIIEFEYNPFNSKAN